MQREGLKPKLPPPMTQQSAPLNCIYVPRAIPTRLETKGPLFRTTNAPSPLETPEGSPMGSQSPRGTKETRPGPWPRSTPRTPKWFKCRQVSTTRLPLRRKGSYRPSWACVLGILVNCVWSTRNVNHRLRGRRISCRRRRSWRPLQTKPNWTRS